MYGVKTMGQLARMSLTHEDFLYKLFGVNAELLIDHAWGYEPCTMDMVKAYRPESNSLCSGQVLKCAYDFAKARVVVQEMIDAASLDLVDKRLVTDQLVLYVGYDTESLSTPAIRDSYHGEVVVDRYGRPVPKPSSGSINLPMPTSSARLLSEAMLELFDRIVNRSLLIRRLSITTNHVVHEELLRESDEAVQLDLFTDYDTLRAEKERVEQVLARERRMQEAVLNIKKRYGKNSLLKGLNFAEGATAKERNQQIGGHKA
jgi:DNA polymerase V